MLIITPDNVLHDLLISISLHQDHCGLLVVLLVIGPVVIAVVVVVSIYKVYAILHDFTVS